MKINLNNIKINRNPHCKAFQSRKDSIEISTNRYFNKKLIGNQQDIRISEEDDKQSYKYLQQFQSKLTSFNDFKQARPKYMRLSDCYFNSKFMDLIVRGQRKDKSILNIKKRVQFRNIVKVQVCRSEDKYCNEKDYNMKLINKSIMQSIIRKRYYNKIKQTTSTPKHLVLIQEARLAKQNLFNKFLALDNYHSGTASVDFKKIIKTK